MCVCVLVEESDDEIEAKPHVQEEKPVSLFSVKTESSKEKESTIFMLEDRNRALISEVQELRRQLSLAPVKKEGAVIYVAIYSAFH